MALHLKEEHIMSSQLVDKLFESDAASALTNQAARRIERLEQSLEALVQESIAVTEGTLDDHTSEVVDGAIEVMAG
jgi:hypothetical protein